MGSILAVGVIAPSLIQLLVLIVVLGVIAWLVQTYIPMEARIKNIFVGVMILIVLLLILRTFGII